eukprot:4388323-Pyramimonas_sp.AAC.1
MFWNIHTAIAAMEARSSGLPSLPARTVGAKTSGPELTAASCRGGPRRCAWSRRRPRCPRSRSCGAGSRAPKGSSPWPRRAC